MKIIVYKDGDTIYKVESFEIYIDKGFTPEAIIEKVNDFKGAEVVSVPQNLEEIFRFLLGEKQFKFLYDLNDMMEDLNGHIKSIKEYEDTLEEIRDSMEYASSSIYDIKDTLEKFGNLKQ